ncbi:hypothetical protein SAMN05216285_2134 [Natrinema salifodinae]|uniref:Uncharacterized protein n=1 Tax=Natrinema salifodinae TaxID=1202768 RepID=A0A1I0P6N9_9EURY|nr:hypothetical protein SAMN05216285_2134 [Natrinema salifodinae]
MGFESVSADADRGRGDEVDVSEESRTAIGTSPIGGSIPTA